MNDVKVIWNPQGFGSPDLKANSADAYYPGDKYVDVVANDLYDFGRGVEWEANLDLYRGHPASRTRSANGASAQGIDHPDFVQKMANFVVQPPAGRDDHLLPQPERLDLRPRPTSRGPARPTSSYILPLG